MKSARERAEEALSIAADGNLGDEEATLKIELLFKGHARDQRRLCAHAINEADYTLSRGAPVDTAHAACMNASAPGEQR